LRKKALRLYGHQGRTVKKSAITEFSNPRSTGIIAINLEAKDELIGASSQTVSR